MELTMPREIEENGQVFGRVVVMARIGEARGRIPKFVKEGVTHGLDGRQALGGSVLQKCRNQVNGLRGSFPEYLGIISIRNVGLLEVIITLLKGCGLI